MPSIACNSPGAFIKASRPQTLGATLCPVLIGSAFAYAQGVFLPRYFCAAMLTALLLQVLANVVNDYGDFKKGADGNDRLGPPRAMQMGWISKRVMEQFIAGLLVLIIALGLVLIAQGGLAIFLAGFLGLVICLCYTLGPRPLAYVGYVEIIIFFVFGPGEVGGAYYIHGLSVSHEALAMSLSPGFLACALNMTNNLRDINQDRMVHKNTMAVRYGEQAARMMIVGCLVLSLLGPMLFVLLYDYSYWFFMLWLCWLPALKMLPIVLHEPISTRFNLMLKSIGQTLYLLGLFASISIVYASSSA